MKTILKVIERPDSGLNLWQGVERFLETTISDSLKHRDGFSVVENLDANGIEKLILERPPFLCVNKAVILDKKGTKEILSTSVVTKEMCEGHFPNRLIIPLLIFSKIIALTGEILVSWIKKDSDIVPLAMRTGEVRTASRDLITPPALILTEAEFLSEKFNYCWINATAWVGNERAAIINKLAYFLMERSHFLSGSKLDNFP